MNKKLRFKVFSKYDGRCAYCGCLLPDKWHIDHLEPIKRTHVWDKVSQSWRVSGCDHPELDCFDNMMPSCPSCNINKHNDSVETFRNNIKGYLKSLNERMVQYQMVRRYNLVRETNYDVIFYFERHEAIDEVLSINTNK